MTTYTKKYYEGNKNQILEERKYRYRYDEKYRKRVLARAKLQSRLRRFTCPDTADGKLLYSLYSAVPRHRYMTWWKLQDTILPACDYVSRKGLPLYTEDQARLIRIADQYEPQVRDKIITLFWNKPFNERRVYEKAESESRKERRIKKRKGGKDRIQCQENQSAA